MAKILIPIAILSFHLKYYIFHLKFNFSLLKISLFSFLNVLTPSSTLLNTWSIVIIAVLMTLSINLITCIIWICFYWFVWFSSLWVIFCCFNLHAWFKKSTSRTIGFQALWTLHCWMLDFFWGGVVEIVSIKYFLVMSWDIV